MNKTNTPSTSPPNQLKALLGKNRDTVLVFVSAQFTEFLDHTDEALMDFAEQAQNHVMQGRFFEAMTGIRKQRADIEKRFRTEIIKGFAEFAAKPLSSDKKSNQSEELSLLDQDEMEESVISENLVTRCRNNYFTQLYALARRLNAMFPERKVTEEHIPGGPTHLVQAFRRGISNLSVHVKAKIVLYALYDKFVLRQLHGMYEEFNDSLKSAGILPNLKTMVQKSKSPAEQSKAKSQNNKSSKVASKDTQTSSPNNSSKDTASNKSKNKDTKATQDTTGKPDQKLGEELFDSILDLMSNQRPDRPSGEGSVPREDVISAIDKIRPTQVGAGAGVLSDIDSLPKLAVDPQFLDKVKQALDQEREQVFSQVDRNEIQAIDSDTIDLVGMLFDYMLKDPLLPNVAKALLSHLHTPYLKLALIDQTLLTDSEHPARILLDMLVEAGGRWVSESDIKRGIFPQIQSVVDRVLQEVANNPALMPELLEYFRKAMDQQRRRSDGIERRTQDTMKGKEKLLTAKQQAAKKIQEHIHEVLLPEPVEKFLFQAWTDRLAFILLRHADGEQNSEWQEALQMTDNLVWLFDPNRAETSLRAVEEVRVGILQNIKTTLETMGGYHQQHLESLFQFLSDPKAINNWHENAQIEEISEPLFDPDELVIQSADAMSKMSISANLLSQQAIPGTTNKPKSIPKKATSKNGVDSNTDKEFAERQQALIEKLRRLKFGTWFEFKNDDNTIRRLKMSWLSPATLTCMFVDQAGVQADTKTLADLSLLLIFDKARILPQPRQQFVQRTLVAIKGALQRAMEATD
ncbi:hypothetical protein TI05_11970 [Achromatium sp. WMS3]|nr:hypothetical protein TI05_11970 [Achromatium sp. WMS3]